MTRIFKAPEDTSTTQGVSVFLAGSIEMGTTEDWQTKVTAKLVESGKVGTIYNPRRDDWDSSWVQSIHNAQFKEQVEWELDHLECAGYVFFYFDPNTKSPITLLELGLRAGLGMSAVVVCPDGFWRKGNVEVVCDTYSRNLHLTDNIEDGILKLLEMISND